MGKERLNPLFLSLSLLLACLLWTPASEAVTIKGQPLSNIDDIVKTVTSSDSLEIQKHSIMLFERSSYNGSIRYKPTIFTLNNDGSVRKQHELEGYDISHTTESTVEHFVQRMSLAMSSKRFGQRRTVMHTTPGMHHPDNYEYNVYGFRTIETDGTEDSADISDVPKKDSARLANLGSNRIIWGNAYMTVKGLESHDVFVYLHSSHMAYPGDLYFKFFTSDRNETGNVDWHDLSVQNGDSNGWKLFDHSSGNRGAGVAAGDFDGDGYKNEIAVCWNNNDRVYAYIYRLTFANGQASVQRIYELLIHEAGYWGTVAAKQASPNVVTGDFNGDGKDEAAFVNKTFPQGEAQNQMRVTVINYNKKNDSWEVSMAGISGLHESACKVTRCDFDGNGTDELAILFFEEHDYALWPRLERWYLDNNGGIQRDTKHIKGGSDTSVLGYFVAGDYNRYYRIAEDFCITAGPVMGTKGGAKLAEDIVISHVNNEASKVFLIPTQLDSSGRFAGFGDTKTIYNISGADSAKRGAVITADFANESLMLDKPSHTVDDHDESYIAVLEAFPYHIDNVDIHGNLTSYPINYTFSGFTGDEGNGEMNVIYTKTEITSSDRDVSFVMASTTETIGLLGDAGPAVHSGLSFMSTAANIAGNFDPRIKTDAQVFNSIMDLITDRIDKTTTNGTREASQRESVTTMEADAWDVIHKYSAAQHIWRYKILNRPIPSWYVLGPKADMSSKDLKAESKDRYITFTIYDTAHPDTIAANQTDLYQPLHEEGNFFSYPCDLKMAEGYNEDGLLIEDTEKSATWSKGLWTGTQVTFSKKRIDSLKYDEHITRSPLSKLISAVAAAFGADDPIKLPPYTSHNETTTKSFSTTEMIDFRLRGRSTEPGEYAGNKLHFVPYLSREGAMVAAMAVTLTEGAVSPLWGSNSLYSKLPDPALLLPGKYKRVGATLVTNDIAGAAMKMRGMRFYVESLDLHSDTDFLAGLTYKIRVPLYNASFLETGSFDVRLSYAYVGRGKGMFDKERPYDTTQLTPIQTLSGITMGGWSNASSNSNKKWLEFTWKVPENAVTGDCVFYVQIDPGKRLAEVHESRMDSAGRILDSGGNNEGYFNFHITSLFDAQDLAARKKTRASVKASGVVSPRGTIYRAVSRNASENGGGVFSSEGGSDKISTMSTFGDLEGLDLRSLLGVFGEGYSNGEDNVETIRANDNETYPVVVNIKYEGDEYYPEAYFYGFNYKPGSQNGDFSEVDHSFMQYRMALVPHTTSTLIINVSKEYMDFINGTGFEIVVPELSESATIYTVSDDYEGSTGDDTGGDDSGESEPIRVLPSSSGGCETGTGIFAALIFAGALLFRKSGRR